MVQKCDCAYASAYPEKRLFPNVSLLADIFLNRDRYVPNTPKFIWAFAQSLHWFGEYSMVTDRNRHIKDKKYQMLHPKLAMDTSITWLASQKQASFRTMEAQDLGIASRKETR